MGLNWGFWSSRRDSSVGRSNIHQAAFLVGIGLMTWHTCNFAVGLYSICSTTTDSSLFYTQYLNSFHTPDQPPTHDLAKLIERANNLTRRQIALSEQSPDEQAKTLDEMLILQREMRELLKDIDARKSQMSKVENREPNSDWKFTVIAVLLPLINFLTTMFMSFGNYTNRPLFYKPFLFCEPFFVGLHFCLFLLVVRMSALVAFGNNEVRELTNLTKFSMIVACLIFAAIVALRLCGLLVVRRSYKLLVEGIELTVRADDPNKTLDLSVSRNFTNERVQTENE